jgi:integrase/recombinase XerD
MTSFVVEDDVNKPYATRGIRGPARPLRPPGLADNMHPPSAPAFLFTWLKTQGIDHALIQPHSGHGRRQSLKTDT